MNKCFEVCSCCCGSEGVEFDKVISSETKFGVTMRQIIHTRIGWFCGADDPTIRGWDIRNNGGVYILWDRDDYCATHEFFHCSALYVGKGAIQTRLISHAKRKRPQEDEITYFSYFPTSNRAAKYIEQLILDTYHLPLNENENTGQGTLCAYINQSESDFGEYLELDEE